MVHLPPLIQDLGFILITAAVVTLVFKSLKQPVVLGYLIAGFLVGPHFTLLPKVTDVKSITVWAEIGVIFLLFSLGLEFSFKKLVKVGPAASITAFFEILFMLGLGYLCGRAFGWSNMDSIFLGGILSISSTTIIVRAIDELGLKGRNFVSLVFGVLIVEDLAAILLLVLLTAVSVTQTFSGYELLMSSGKLGFFLALWFLVGIYLLPTFLGRVRRLLNDETTLVVSIALCLMMVMIATQAGFSPALGAFVMGSILAETREGAKIEHLLVPVKNLFAAVFFVSVGMMIDPQILKDHFGVLIILTLLTIVGKFVASALGALVAGKSLRNSVQAGLSLAQIGEFSFIIATLGVTLKVTSDFLYPLAVAVSAITTFTTPYQMKYADRFYAWIECRLPPTLMARLKSYQTAATGSGSETMMGLLWSVYGKKVFFNFILFVAVALLGSKVLLPIVEKSLGVAVLAQSILLGLTLVLGAPFLWAVVLSTPKNISKVRLANVEQLKRLQLGISIVRAVLGLLLVVFVFAQYLELRAFYGLIVVLVGVAAVFLSKYSEPFYLYFENRFLENLNDKERESLDKRSKLPQLAPWDASLLEVTVSPYSDFGGKSLLECKLKETFGVTVTMIKRGQKLILTPGRDEIIGTGDRLFLIGTEEQLVSARKAIEIDGKEDDSIPEVFGMDSVLLQSHHAPFVGNPIRDCGFRDVVKGLIVGIEREGQRILSPDSSLVLKEGDLIWVVGDKSKIAELKKDPVVLN